MQPPWKAPFAFASVAEPLPLRINIRYSMSVMTCGSSVTV